MLEGEPRQGVGHDGIDQFMFHPHSNTRHGESIGTSDPYHPIEKHKQLATGEPVADSSDFISSIVERFLAFEQRVLGIAVQNFLFKCPENLAIL